MKRNHPFRISRLIKLSRNSNRRDFGEFFEKIEPISRPIQNITFSIPVDNHSDAISDWLAEALNEGHAGFFCVAYTPSPIPSSRNVGKLFWDWGVLRTEYFYAPTYDELEQVVQQWANNLYEGCLELINKK